jgi:membrane protein DedA with SNARE-associated domain
MWDEILKAIPAVFVPSMLKLILGPLAGYGLKLNMFVTMIATVAGMMTVVTVIVYSGQIFRARIERFFERTLKHGKVARFVEKYGLLGVAFFTPLILMPIPGALLALGFQAKHTKKEILLYMLISGSAWSVIFTLVIYFLGHKVLPDFIK